MIAATFDAKDAKREMYDIVWVRVSALRRYIKRWAETLVQAGADQGDLELAEHHDRIGQR